MVASDLAGSPSPIGNTRCSIPVSTSRPMPAWVTMAARRTPAGSTSAKWAEASGPTSTG